MLSATFSYYSNQLTRLSIFQFLWCVFVTEFYMCVHLHTSVCAMSSLLWTVTRARRRIVPTGEQTVQLSSSAFLLLQLCLNAQTPWDVFIYLRRPARELRFVRCWETQTGSAGTSHSPCRRHVSCARLRVKSPDCRAGWSRSLRRMWPITLIPHSAHTHIGICLEIPVGKVKQASLLICLLTVVLLLGFFDVYLKAEVLHTVIVFK